MSRAFANDERSSLTRFPEYDMDFIIPQCYTSGTWSYDFDDPESAPKLPPRREADHQYIISILNKVIRDLDMGTLQLQFRLNSHRKNYIPEDMERTIRHLAIIQEQLCEYTESHIISARQDASIDSKTCDKMMDVIKLGFPGGISLRRQIHARIWRDDARRRHIASALSGPALDITNGTDTTTAQPYAFDGVPVGGVLVDRVAARSISPFWIEQSEGPTVVTSAEAGIVKWKREVADNVTTFYAGLQERRRSKSIINEASGSGYAILKKASSFVRYLHVDKCKHMLPGAQGVLLGTEFSHPYPRLARAV
ncbi:hypothetical protein CAC42_5997 [Sphaceloma murrayae]|uniref:Uncharacterized protein n=1 Tax=Sphaceloma murrayae TaxID=2082308 RepID=A0A2K1QZS7_9PEZI|nr:hypothetical protein CAC42_5997 [Sphaceloma murrayae]